jgi:hypothetical protein
VEVRNGIKRFDLKSFSDLETQCRSDAIKRYLTSGVFLTLKTQWRSEMPSKDLAFNLKTRVLTYHIPSAL